MDDNPINWTLILGISSIIIVVVIIIVSILKRRIRNQSIVPDSLSNAG